MGIPPDTALEKDALLKVGILSCLLEMDELYDWNAAVGALAQLMDEPWVTTHDQCTSALNWFHTNLDGRSAIQVSVFSHVLHAFHDGAPFDELDDDDEGMV